MHPITKSIALFATAALLINAMGPALAHAAKHLHGEQVNADTLVRDAYIAITYRDSNDRERSARGWIDAIGETSFTLRSGGLEGETTIAYANVLSIIMSEESTVPAKQMNEVNRFIRNMKAREIEQAKREAEAERLEEETIKVMVGKEIVPAKITTGWYVHVLYTPEGAKETATGQITGKNPDHITIRIQERDWLWKRKKIAYSDIDTLVMAKYRESVEELKNARQASQLVHTHNAKVRFKAPSLTKKRIVGEVVKITQNTLLIREGRTFDTLLSREGRTFLEVPISSISNFEVSLGQRRNAGKGFLVGVKIGLAVLVPVAIADYSREDDGWRGYATAVVAVYILPPILILSTLIGASIKSEKWVAVPPQRLNLSIAPTPEKGLRAALAVNF